MEQGRNIIKVEAMVKAPQVSSSVCAADKYLLSLRSKSSRTTMASLLSWVAKAIGVSKYQKDAYKFFDWSTLEREHVYRLVEVRREQNASPATINAMLSALRGVFKELYMSGDIDHRKYENLKSIKKEKGTRISRPSSITRDQISCVLKTTDNSSTRDFRDVAIFSVLVGMGLRRTELTKIELKDWGIMKDGVKYLLVNGKGNKQRFLPIPKDVDKLVQKWIKVRGGMEHGVGGVKDFLFCSISKGGKINLGKQLTGVGVQYIITKCIERQGVEVKDKVKPHGLRKLYASNLKKSSIDMTSIQKLLGHSSVTTTQRYVFEDENILIQAVDTVRLYC